MSSRKIIYRSLTLAALLSSTSAYASSISDTGFSQITGISGDGQVAVGNLGPNSAGIWHFGDSSPTSIQDSNVGPSLIAAYAISGDGKVTGGSIIMGGPQPFVYYGGHIHLDGFPGSFISGMVTALSYDGSIAGGEGIHFDGSNYIHNGYVWGGSYGGLLAELSGDNESSVGGLSGDGSIAVGYSANGSTQRAVKWVSSPTPVALDQLSGTDTGVATAISRDGSTIVGSSKDSGSGDSNAVKWNSTNNAVTFLGSLTSGGINSETAGEAHGVNADGSVIVGTSDGHAFYWTPSAGIKDLNVLLANDGVNMSGITLTDVVGVSNNGEYMAVEGSGNYVVFYGTGMGGGLTTLADQQAATQTMADNQQAMLVESRATADVLLGMNRPVDASSYAFAGGMLGSAAGYSGGQFSKNNVTILGGIAYGHQDYDAIDESDAVTVALAGRYMFNPLKSGVRPFAEIGGWVTPNESLTLSRNYANGAGTATGTGDSGAYSWAGYGRAGLAWDVTALDRLTGYGELGQQTLNYDGYSEALSASNPFPAVVSSGRLSYDVAKAGAALTHAATVNKTPVTLTLSGAVAQSFNEQSSLHAIISGVGATQAASTSSTWGEFGAQLNVKLTDQLSANIGGIGISGDSTMGTQLHATVGLNYTF